MDPTVLLLIGALGAALLLAAFSLQKFGILSEKQMSYDFLNLAGAGLLTWYAVLLNSVPFVVLEGIWTLVAGWYLLERFTKK